MTRSRYRTNSVSALGSIASNRANGRSPDLAYHLAIVGAGPKAAAVAARTKELAQIGIHVPRIVVIEQNEPGSSWKGGYGFTTGQQRLGTPPGKDLGYPYESRTPWGRVTDQALFRNFSWEKYSFDQIASSDKSLRRFADRVDRGTSLRLEPPTHAEFGGYIQWALDKSGVEIIFATVIGIRWSGPKWRLHLSAFDGSEHWLSAHSVMITGPGRPRMVDKIDPSARERVFDGKSFFINLDNIREILRSQDLPAAVIGGGETAASVILALKHLVRPNQKIFWLTRSGIPLTRGEGFSENRIFTNPDGWRDHPLELRREMIRVGDRGVVSRAAMASLDLLEKLENRRLDLKEISALNGSVLLRGQAANAYSVSLAVCATGFDPWSFADFFELEDQRAEFAPEKRSDLELGIHSDLALGDEFPGPKLHVPMLAGLAQGPGFPNLSSLGLLSERVLAPYIADKAKLGHEFISRMKIRCADEDAVHARKKEYCWK
jgi:mycobactin lysine-N-oxygenase